MDHRTDSDCKTPGSFLGAVMDEKVRQSIPDELDGWKAIAARLSLQEQALALAEASDANGRTGPVTAQPEAVPHNTGSSSKGRRETTAKTTRWRRWLAWELALAAAAAILILALCVVIQLRLPANNPKSQLGGVVPSVRPVTPSGTTGLVVTITTLAPLTVTPVAGQVTPPATLSGTSSPATSSAPFSCTELAYPGATRLKVNSQTLPALQAESGYTTPLPGLKYAAFGSAASFQQIAGFYRQKVQECGFVSDNNPQVNTSDDRVSMFSGTKAGQTLTISIFSPQWLKETGQGLPSGFRELYNQLGPNQTLILYVLK